ncbi:hypothetical protein Tco_1234535 [Tanacetum coccineum]
MTIPEFAHYFGPNQPSAESIGDSRRKEEEELSPGSFLLPFNINNHNLYANTTLDAKDNIMPQRVYEHLRELEFPCNFVIEMAEEVIILGRPFLESTRGNMYRIKERQTVKGSYMGFADCLQMKIRIGHNNLHESDCEFIFNEWILDIYDVVEEYAREISDPYSRRFEEYNRVFNNEIEHLSNEYILRIGRKGYVLDDVWEKCQQNYKKTNEAWHDEAYEENEMWRIGDEKTDYDPPYVNVKTFEVKKIFF